MIGFLKKVGKGLGYVLFVPFYLVLVVVIGVIGIVILLTLFFKAVYLFFSGRSLRDSLPEDKKAQEILAKSKAGSEQNLTSASTPIEESKEPSIYDNKIIEEVAFDEPLKEEADTSEIIEEDTQPNIVEEDVKIEDVSFEEYTPLTNEENKRAFFTKTTPEDKEEDE